MRRIGKLSLAAGAMTLFLATLLGAYGSHTLRGALAPEAWASYQTAVEYQFYHGLALLALGLIGDRHPRPSWTAAGASLFCAGLLFFCGGIYAATFGAPRMLLAAVPLGGALFMLGWLWLVALALTLPTRRGDT